MRSCRRPLVSVCDGSGPEVITIMMSTIIMMMTMMMRCMMMVMMMVIIVMMVMICCRNAAMSWRRFAAQGVLNRARGSKDLTLGIARPAGDDGGGAEKQKVGDTGDISLLFF